MTNIEWAELRVRDLVLQERFYCQLLDLEVLKRDGSRVELGLEGRALLKLQADPKARVPEQAHPGLFHLAFWVPDMGRLGGWLQRSQVPLEGASDHGVSRALYLSDPENNGLEIYADTGARVEMGTRRLDLPALLHQARPWSALGLRLGHIHLRSLSAYDGQEWFARLGMTPSARYPGAEFYAADGYHHYFAVNQWGVRPAPAGNWTGLIGYALSGPFATAEVCDPWGHRVQLTSASVSVG
ncbi:MAG: VOC family protein [Candidatus Eremiobacteraeota bacterium]|nr:VOC family protein [Candidatus Eremiobacteraeota bacterium]MCW5865823.1 VOC family protein [Candidatus Eremiobacteraeota bacterium]